MAKYQSKSSPSYNWKTSKTTIDFLKEKESKLNGGTLAELRRIEEEIGLSAKVPNRPDMMSSQTSASVESGRFAERADLASDRAPEPEKLKTEEVHEVRDLITKENESVVLDKLVKHIDSIIGKGNLVRRTDAQNIAKYAFKLGRLYEQNGTIDNVIVKK